MLHVSGGLHEGENITFGKYLSDYNKYVTAESFGGNVDARVKPNGDYDYPSENLNIKDKIDNGVGMLSYYGHGSPTQTDNDIGYASSTSRNYANLNKYPVLYFNGCGVGNIFSGRFTSFPADDITTQIPLSSDWLLASQKGAIAVIANSYYAFEESSRIYLGALYKGFFKSNATRQTIGKIQQDATRQVMNGYTGNRTLVSLYDIANNHQSLLQGDPALKVLIVGNALPVDLALWEGHLVAGNEVLLNWKTNWKKTMLTLLSKEVLMPKISSKLE